MHLVRVFFRGLPRSDYARRLLEKRLNVNVQIGTEARIAGLPSAKSRLRRKMADVAPTLASRIPVRRNELAVDLDLAIDLGGLLLAHDEATRLRGKQHESCHRNGDCQKLKQLSEISHDHGSIIMPYHGSIIMPSNLTISR
jgi:hypothetical protein